MYFNVTLSSFPTGFDDVPWVAERSGEVTAGEVIGGGMVVVFGFSHQFHHSACTGEEMRKNNAKLRWMTPIVFYTVGHGDLLQCVSEINTKVVKTWNPRRACFTTAAGHLHMSGPSEWESVGDEMGRKKNQEQQLGLLFSLSSFLVLSCPLHNGLLFFCNLLLCNSLGSLHPSHLHTPFSLWNWPVDSSRGGSTSAILPHPLI